VDVTLGQDQHVEEPEPGAPLRGVVLGRLDAAAEGLAEPDDQPAGFGPGAQPLRDVAHRLDDPQGRGEEEVAAAVEQLLAAADEVGPVREAEDARVGAVHLLGGDDPPEGQRAGQLLAELALL